MEKGRLIQIATFLCFDTVFLTFPDFTRPLLVLLVLLSANFRFMHSIDTGSRSRNEAEDKDNTSFVDTATKTQRNMKNGKLTIHHNQSTGLSRSSNTASNSNCASPSSTIHADDDQGERALVGGETEAKPTGLQLVVILTR